jgi:KEOPS complex subunit Pcc1
VEDLAQSAIATIHLRFPSEKMRSIITGALDPETRSSVTNRSRVILKQEQKTITLIFKSTDTTAIRASLNSYLNWLHLLFELYHTIESIKI